MNLKHLSYFIAIAKRESFTKAAEDIYVSQSALSKAVKNLEQSLGVDLIDRTSKLFALTEAGRILFNDGENLLSYISERQKEINNKIKKTERKVSVGIPPVISTAYFSYLIYNFKQQYPDIELEFIEVGANTVQALVDEGKIDIGVVILPFKNSENYIVTPAVSSESVLVVNRNHRLSVKDEVSFEELKNEQFHILNSTYMLHDKIINNCLIAGFKPNIVTESSQWDFLAEMVALDQGISILPKPIIKRFYSKEKLKTIRLKDPAFPWNIAMIVKKDKYITEQMQLFTRFVEENMNYSDINN